LIATDLSAHRLDEASFDQLLRGMMVELASVQAAVRQVITAQQDLVDAIRLEFDRAKPIVRLIRADELMERACKSIRGLAGNVELRCAASRLTFLSDERWVQRILNNLITNAVWHSDGSKIFVCARRRGRDIVFEVRDNGRGMTPEKMVSVFEVIKAPSPCSVGYPASAGLGLYSARLFTARLGGSVDCASSPGRGSLFRIRLPGPVGTVARQIRFRSVAAVQAARNKMVVVLDEDVSVLRTTERVLGSLGVEVYADYDPLRWLNVVTDLKRMPDLFLIGYRSRGQDCSSKIEIVRRKWRGQDPRIIVMVGDGRNPCPLDAYEKVWVLKKPLSREEFECVIGVLSGASEPPGAV
jgi:hypothetical protein